MARLLQFIIPGYNETTLRSQGGEAVEKLRFPNSLSLETTISSETEEKPRPEEETS